MENHIEIADVQRAVADYYRVSVADLCGLYRTVPIVRHRQLAYWLCRRHTVASFPAIAQKFGSREHTTVLHGVQAVERRLAFDADLRRDVEDIERLAGLVSCSRKATLVTDRLDEIDRAKRRIDGTKEAFHGLQSLWS